MTLKLAPKLQLPNDAVTQTFLILGKRGSGKTNTAVVLAEEMIKLAPIVVLDPIDAWWGLKSSFAGDEPGLNIYVFGGRHPDLPLDPHSGELMAGLFIEHRISMVLSMKGWSVSDRARFVTDFVTYLLNHNDRVPVHVFLEEADAFIPQRPQPDEAKMLGATDRLIRWGRMDGIGATAISQRSAAINKNTTTQAETLVAHRTIGPQDRDAIEEWIKFHGTKEERDKVLSELPHLHNGEAYVWSPEWLKLLERIFIRRRHTFDSASTPKVGEKMITPKTLSKVDLQKISGQLQTVIDHAKQDDPRELRKQLAEAQKLNLELSLSIKNHALAKPTVEERVVEKIINVYSMPPGAIDFIKTMNEQSQKILEQPLVWKTEADPDTMVITIPKANIHRVPESKQPFRVPPQPETVVTSTYVERPRGKVAEAVRDLKFPQRKILNALAWMEGIGQRGSHWTIIAMLASQSPKSSGFANNVSFLRSNGLLEGNQRGGLTLTGPGRHVAVAPDIPVSSEEILRAIEGKISEPQAKILRYLMSSGSPSLAQWETVAKYSIQSPTSSGFANNVSVLRSMGLVRGNRGSGLEATPILFPELRT